MADIIDLLDQKSARNFETIHNSMVQSAIDSIKKNLNDKSIHLLLPFCVSMVLSPEFLCRVQNQHLWAMQDALEAEANYREEERIA